MTKEDEQIERIAKILRLTPGETARHLDNGVGIIETTALRAKQTDTIQLFIDELLRKLENLKTDEDFRYIQGNLHGLRLALSVINPA